MAKCRKVSLQSGGVHGQSHYKSTNMPSHKSQKACCRASDKRPNRLSTRRLLKLQDTGDRTPKSDSTANLTLALPQEFIQLDLTSQQLFDLLADQHFDTIFHLAGMAYASHSVQAPAQDFAQNLAATFNLLEALRRGSFSGRFVYASTAAVYGEPQQLPISASDQTDFPLRREQIGR